MIAVGIYTILLFALLFPYAAALGQALAWGVAFFRARRSEGDRKSVV